MPNKYPSQQKHMEDNYERFPLNLRNGVKQRFQKCCEKQKTSAMAVLQQYVEEYLEKYEKK